MNLSPHFTLAELTASAKAQQRGIDNTPPRELLPRMMLLAELLERVRTELAVPVTVTSGSTWRSVRRSARTSQATSSKKRMKEKLKNDTTHPWTKAAAVHAPHRKAHRVRICAGL
ncbi:MAG: D-Ala-D-Ala carboxypeptidase family metallohydrolase [Rhodoferax sp.]